MANITFDSLKKDISNRNFAPVYLLMGDEAYFIDQLTELLLEKVLT
ncbi:MAG TPA: DNA polymerase III subunit delta, partial [Porphyromonadaceae bacterium]|nr:DNA polymerase III subunit delta [Porphyromonadaceae bacterium]